ncbi:MAG: spore germination protein [Defluviitaleaceae bacterium]|nr:spore germination protein [Defluviitaleaceae bacterium]
MISVDISKIISRIEELFADCADVIKGEVSPCPGVRLYMVYIDNMIDRRTIDRHVITPVLERLKNASVPYGGAFDIVKKTLSTLDIQENDSFDDILTFILSGDTALFIDGSDKGIIIASRGFGNRGVPDVSTEVTVMGSREAFSEVVRINTALIRRRIRDTKLKIKQLRIGKRSQTDVAFMYVEDIARTEAVTEVERLLNDVNADAVTDVGVLEQLIEKSWYSPFPQAETTERPDKAAASILEGRIVITVDNSPFVLMLPVTLNSLYQSADDYFQRFWVMSFTRILRFAAGLIAVALPGLYLAAAVYHPALLPSTLMLKMAEARVNVPFPAVAEILLMEASFELLREAGTRMPQAVGGTLGIVGGLIIGNAAVQAGIVSPIVVVVVALTAIASFAIPSNALVTGYRMVKFMVIILTAVFGLLGFWAGMLIILVHLSSLCSLGIPYLFPFVSRDISECADLKDSLVRMPTRFLKKRPYFAQNNQQKRM